MKSWCLILLITCFLFSCSGSKNVISETKTSQKQATSDTISTTTKEVIKMTDSLYVPDSEEEIKVLSEPILELEPKLNRFKHDRFNKLLKKHVSKIGNVNYEAIKSDWDELQTYIAELGKNIPKADWSKNQKLAYWINAYNAMTIDLILRHYPLKGIKDIKNPWKQRYWKLGEKWYNLDEIEHQILRKMDEPRIHFAIVCASFSCPKLQNAAFTASDLEIQLTEVTKAFLSDLERNSISENSLELSKIFQWFGKDFKQNGSLIDFLNQYTDIQISDKAKISFKDYNWDLNE
ncbi:MAG: DUF547 domain-containing protein [Jejuia sp.]